MKKIMVRNSVGVVAPSHSWDTARDRRYEKAISRLHAAGFSVKVAANVRNIRSLGTASIGDRLDDLHAAYSDDTIDYILCLQGGCSANELLEGIDWELVRNNPKPLIGYSDSTVLVNAIYAMTGATAILGPNLSSFGQVGWKDSLDWLQQLLWSDSVLTLRKPQTWASGARHYSTNRSWKCTSSATASGTLIGGNLGSLYLLQGTKYMPRFDTPTILVIEDDAEAGVFAAAEFDRRIESLLQQPGARQHIVGVLVGRFEVASRVGLPQVQEILLRKFGDRIPIVYDMNFGHTQPALACLLAEWQQYRQQIRLYASALNQSIRNERIVP